MQITRTVGNGQLILKTGDITLEETDIIVNAANSAILGGGGVDGAIHRAAGPALLKECQALREQQRKNGEFIGCRVGEAVITTAGKLKAKFVVHAVGPDMRGGLKNGDELLQNVYRKSLELAEKHQAKTIAFPSISTGIYSFPIEKAAKIAVATAAEFLQNARNLEVRFILFSEEDFKIYQKALESLAIKTEDAKS